MKLLLAGLAVLVLAAAFAIGWGAAAEPPTVVALARRGAPAIVLADPNPRGRFGVDLLAAGLTGGAVPTTPEAEPGFGTPQAVRPAEPDVAEAFRRQLTAVVAQRAGGPYYALLSGDGGRQVLRPGDGYLFGWRLARLDLQEAVFARGRERRAVDLFAPQPAAQPEAPADPPSTADPGPTEPPAASSTTDGVSTPPLD